MTLINTERISAWLQEPHHLQEIAPEAILQLANDYPFFAPASYFLLINGNKGADAFVRLQQMHPVNTVMLHHDSPFTPMGVMRRQNGATRACKTSATVGRKGLAPNIRQRSVAPGDLFG